MTRVQQESMINLHHIRSSELCHKKSLYPWFFTCFSNNHKLYIIWKLKISKFQKSHFEIGHCVTIETVLQNVLAGSSPLAAVSYYKMYYGLLESKLFIILTKYISLERSESQDSIFGGYFVIDVILREKLIDLWQKCNGVWMHPVAVFGITPKQNCIWTSIFFKYQLQIWNTTYVDIWL